MKRTAAVALVVLSVGTFLFATRSRAQGDLQITFGGNGPQQLIYKGVVLEDLNQFPDDALRINHMKMTDLSGNVISTGQYGWGENNNGRSWDSGSQTWRYSYVWGSISVGFVQVGNALNMKVTETNLANSGVVLDGVTILPMALHFPQLPAGFYDASYPQLAFNTTAPSVTNADFGSGQVVAVMADATKPLYSGFQPSGSQNAYYTMISSTSPDGLATFQPHNDRPVAPGQTDSFTVSLRFVPSGTSIANLAQDAYQNWAATWPPQLMWNDRRIIGTVYLASSPQGAANQAAGYPNNPRRYFNDSNATDFNVGTAAGLRSFQGRILKQAQLNVNALKQLGAQGAITWDIEGEQYPQATSYVCSPDQIAQVAPEMETTITDKTSAYAGMKLDDAYFKVMRDAGYRVGVCIRPQHFTRNPDGTAQQDYLADADIPAEIIRKMKYAHDRWGATLFYIDSTVEMNGAVLDASIFQQAAAALPDSLLIPEETTPKHYAYTGAFQSFLFHGEVGTDLAVYNYYPNAFSVNLINDVDPAKLSAAQAQLTAAVHRGDILMTHADYWQANNPTIVQIYKDAGVNSSAPAPSQGSTPTPMPALPKPSPQPGSAVVITSPLTGTTLSGQVTVQASIGVSLDAAGSYLMVDGVEIGTQRVSSSPFAYPLNTATLTNGSHTLQLWAHDTANTTTLSSAVTVTIDNTSASSQSTASARPASASASCPIALTYPVSGQAVSGLINVSATIGQTLDAAGSFLLLDGREVGTKRIGAAPFLYQLDASSLAAGSHILQVWAHDTGNDTLLSNAVSIVVGTSH